eukprot:5233868-Alexandrium_andersonii.AAC.1
MASFPAHGRPFPMARSPPPAFSRRGRAVRAQDVAAQAWGRGSGRGRSPGSRGMSEIAYGHPAPGAGGVPRLNVPGFYFQGRTRTPKDP